MHKRGQVFLIAALIVLSIVLGLSIVYSSARVVAGSNRVPLLAEEIKYEAVQTIGNAAYVTNGPGEEDQQTKKNLDTMIKSYANSNPDVEMVLIYEKKIKEAADPHNFKFIHKNPSAEISDNKLEYDPAQRTVKFPFVGQLYSFTDLAGRDVYVIVKREKTKDGDLYIASA